MAKWKIKKIGNRTYRGKKGFKYWTVQYKSKGKWKDTVNESVHRGKVTRKFV